MFRVPATGCDLLKTCISETASHPLKVEIAMMFEEQSLQNQRGSFPWQFDGSEVAFGKLTSHQ